VKIQKLQVNDRLLNVKIQSRAEVRDGHGALKAVKDQIEVENQTLPVFSQVMVLITNHTRTTQFSDRKSAN
jgi:hypothetical protein